MHSVACDKSCDARSVLSSSPFSLVFVFIILLNCQGQDKPGPEGKKFCIDTFFFFYSSSVFFIRATQKDKPRHSRLSSAQAPK